MKCSAAVTFAAVLVAGVAASGGGDDGTLKYDDPNVCSDSDYVVFLKDLSEKQVIIDEDGNIDYDISNLVKTCFPGGTSFEQLDAENPTFSCTCSSGPDAAKDNCNLANSTRRSDDDAACSKEAKELYDDDVADLYEASGDCSDACVNLLKQSYKSRCYWRLYYESKYSVFGLQAYLDEVNTACLSVKWGMIFLLLGTSLVGAVIGLAGFGQLSMLLRSRSEATAVTRKTEEMETVKDNVELTALKEDS